MERTDLQRVYDQFYSQFKDITDANQKIIFKQVFAIQHKISADLLDSYI